MSLIYIKSVALFIDSGSEWYCAFRLNIYNGERYWSLKKSLAAVYTTATTAAATCNFNVVNFDL